MREERFRGLFPIVHTPFDENGEVDFDSLRRLVRHVADQGVEGITFPGFASEFWRLTDGEIGECAECIVEAAESRVTVILNVTAQATVPAVKQARAFRGMGARAAMVLPPFTVGVPAGGLEEHLGAVLEASGLPAIVQDSAGLTGTTLEPAALARLKARCGNFAGLKVDQVPTGPAISRYRAVEALAGLSFVVGYSGVQMLDAVRRGAEGLMGGCGHLKEDRRMVDALLDGGGFEEFRRLAPLLNFEMQSLEMVIAVHKRLLNEAGVIATPLSRGPCRAMDEVHAGELAMQMAAVRS
jgi:4-hydroxy-tetrahydrodipicolinate synthase